MDIVIPTYGRADHNLQATAAVLQAEGIKPVLVVQERESRLFDWYPGPVHVLPPSIQTVSPTRDYIVHEMVGGPKVCMLDDDLKFAVRRADDPTKFRNLQDGDLRRMLYTIEDGLDVCPHVGIGAREGGNRNTEEFMHNTRMMRVLAYDRRYLKRKLITFAPMVVMEDFHVTLQILRSGADTMVCNTWVSDQAGGSNATGGCSSYRTAAVQSAAAHQLAALHPGFVRVVQKATKTAWGGGTRDDVVVSWKQARRSA